jgi:quinoprotein glucose dehydrogenase
MALPDRKQDISLGRISRVAIALSLAAFAGAIGVGTLSAQSGPPAAPALPDGPGRDLFVQTCSQCHALGTATGKRRSAEEWTGVIERMIGMGAPIDAVQAKTIQAYLATHFGVTALAPAAGPAATPSTAPAEHYPRPEGPNQWASYGGGGDNANFSPLGQITPKNVAKLRQAWVYHYGAGQNEQGDQGLDYRFEVTPLIIGDVMYISTPASPLKPDLKSTITALRPETGELLWKYESPANIHGRGIAYWPGDEKTAPRIIFGTDGGMIAAVDVTTGQLARGFGRRGQIDAYVGVASEIVGDSRRSTYTIPNPVTIYRNLLITGARPGEVGPPAPRGDIRAFDARTGRLVWEFHTVPQPGEANHDAYAAADWRNLSGANVWSSMSLDEANGIVYAPTGDLNGNAKGTEYYANSLLALDAATGKLKWFRQITHHDIWDWDSPTPPMLLDVTRGGKTIPAVALTGKHGLFFLFDRLTGESLNGFEERPTPRPDEPSEDVWPTQPFPIAPGPVARTQMTRDEVADLAPGMKAFCQDYWDRNDVVSAPLYAPRQSSRHATITYPGPTGGPNWGGGSYIPALGLYFINVQNRAIYRPKAAPGSGPGMMMHASPEDDPMPGAAPAPRPPRGRGAAPFTFQTPDGLSLSCGATPWGELVAVDVQAQRIAWRVPLGMTETLGARGANTGAPNLGGTMATKAGLVFVGATNDRRFRAFDARTGRKLWETELEASAHAAPISYMGKNGKQYVVVAAGGGTSVGGPRMSDAIMAYTLP